MDLKELKKDHRRHPWEIARAHTTLRILREVCAGHDRPRMLDVGCGDGYVASRLAHALRPACADGLDINLTVEQLQELQASSAGVMFHNVTTTLRSDYDLMLCMDVIEHVPDAVTSLRTWVQQYVRTGGFVFITVPAFQVLYSTHDAFLGHHRRFSHRALLNVIERCGLQRHQSGYLFATLLPIRLLTVLLRKARCGPKQFNGLGSWMAPDVVTSIVVALFRLDHWVCVRLARWHILLPGLSVWALATKR